YFHAEVSEVRSLSSVMRRIVLGGDGLADYRSSGAPDEWFRLMVPPERQQRVELPSQQGRQFHFDDPQPAPRWYSLRRWDPERHEATVDIVVHDHGVATRWAEAVQLGDQVLISQPHGRGIDTEADWVLIMADQTGIPAACRILESLLPGQRAHAVFEAPDEAATFTPTSPADLRVCWAYNPSPASIPSPLSAPVRTVELPPGRGYVWMAGEASCARAVRRYFRHELKWRSQQFDIVGYWRPDAEVYQRRFREVEEQVATVYEAGQRRGADSEDILDEVYSVMESRGL
ncbi:MAG: siderophore-interacting protein, partial [Microlunatus sp.]|nr:siderophore-interacting protein [Microlunatus sp.]